MLFWDSTVAVRVNMKIFRRPPRYTSRFVAVSGMCTQSMAASPLALEKCSGVSDLALWNVGFITATPKADSFDLQLRSSCIALPNMSRCDPRCE